MKKIIIASITCASIFLSIVYPCGAAPLSPILTVYKDAPPPTYSGNVVDVDAYDYFNDKTIASFFAVDTYRCDWPLAWGDYTFSGKEILSRKSPVTGRFDTIQNDAISSLSIGAGYKVTLYQNDDRSGSQVSFSGPGYFSLAGTAMNDQTSAITIENLNQTPLKNDQISYSAHVSGIGWMPSLVTNGLVSGGIAGTTGQSRAIESLRVSVGDPSSRVMLSAHVQNIGWLPFTAGESGTTGRSLRTEAYKMYLEGPIANRYSIEYRSHIQNIGWTNWVRDGAVSGTTGQSLRLEAIEIRLVYK